MKCTAFCKLASCVTSAAGLYVSVAWVLGGGQRFWPLRDRRVGYTDGGQAGGALPQPSKTLRGRGFSAATTAAKHCFSSDSLACASR